MSFDKVLFLYNILKSYYPGKFLERSFVFFYIVILFYCMCYCSWCTWFDLTLYSDPFLPEAIKYAKDKMQNFDVFSPEHTQPFLQEGI